MVLCVVLIIKLLPTRSDSKYCPALQTIVAGGLDVDGGLRINCFTTYELYLADYNMCSFYRDFYIATGQLASGFNRRSRGFLVANTHITSMQQKGWGTSFVVATKFTALLNLFLELTVVHRGL